MRSRFLIALLFLVPIPAGALPPLEFCGKGTACWIDASDGVAKTELKFTSDDVIHTELLEPGISQFSFVDLFKDSASSWICVQARHHYPDGKVSGWYLSATEGICKELPLVMPPIIPPVEPPKAIFTIEEHGAIVILRYKAADCATVTKSTKTSKGERVLTITCKP